MAFNLHNRSLLSLGSEAKAQSVRQVITSAVLINLLNPKLTLFFLAFLPQFVPAQAPHPMRQFLLLSAVFMALTLAVFALYGLLAHRFRRGVIDSPRVQTGLRWVFSGAFAGLGLKLAADR